MASLDIGKPEMLEWIKANFKEGETCLDVGACDGKWAKLINGYLICDAVEVYTPNITKHGLIDKYREVFNADIRGLKYNYYDLIIFGDVLEHMTVEEAQEVLKYAKDHCRDYIVAVPYMWHNRSHYGNPYEIHQQEDLTPENTLERYPDLMPRLITERYGYYTKDQTPTCLKNPERREELLERYKEE